MDIARPDLARARRRKRVILTASAVGALLLTTLGLSQLKPAAPTVERASIWVDTVKRGPMVRQVRGLGSLVPEEVRWIAAVTEGRVERILVQPGTPVKTDTVLLEMSNPELEMAALEAESQARAAESQYTELKVRLQSQRLDQQAAAARVQAEYKQARLRAEADAQLAREGLIAGITHELSKTTAEELQARDGIEQQRLAIGVEAVAAQLAVQRATVDQRRGQARLRRSPAEALKVRAGIDGVLQHLPVEVGQQIAPGGVLARVAVPTRLKAVIRVPETQARDVQPGQSASVDTRNGVVAARVTRVDPAVQNGTVTVDLGLEGALPKGARPDLTVDGTIELERLADVLFVGRPAQAQTEGPTRLFRLQDGGAEAVRVPVQLGRASVVTVEVVSGLKEGEEVILSDTSAWDAHDRVRIK
jgi:HlyD family secretion protein